MMKRFAIRLAFLAALESALCIPGLSGQAGVREIRDWNLSALEVGAKVEVGFFRGKGPLSGKYAGTSPSSEVDYADRFSLVRDASEGRPDLPALGEEISLTDSQGKLYQGAFAGFDRGFLLLKIGGAAEASLVNLGMIASLRSTSGAAYDVDRLRSRVRSGEMPFRSSLALDTRAGRIVTPLNEIAWIEAKGEKSRIGIILAALTVGLCVGTYYSLRNFGKGMRFSF